VLDLARELAALGHDVILYSMLPDSRAQHFGLDRRYHRSLLPFVAPFAGWTRLAPNVLPSAASWALVRAHDLAVSAVLEPCDVFIFMSGIFLRAARVARQRYGARLWLERGSRHIVSQAEILAEVPGAQRPAGDIVVRELEGYRLADRIVVPSRHVAESFVRDQDAVEKLFVNPYGTDLEMFPSRQRPRSRKGPFTLMFSGSWSLRKGCDVLVEATRLVEGVKLVHVGSIQDCPFPLDDQRFEHIAHVPQDKLSQIYAAADVFVNASREEGFGMVIAQALASGLPVICTDRTGGLDLAHTPALGSRITVVPHDNVPALQAAIEAGRDASSSGDELPALTEADRETISWKAYARRYEAELLACDLNKS
jgi:glycosyltransferase involved in cell wall biosynthesis